MTAIAVFGAGGFIGRHVVAALARAGHDVRAYDRAGDGVRVLDLDSDAPLVEDATIAIHLAEPGVATGPDHAKQCAKRLRRLLAHPFERVVYVSSAVVYGDAVSTPRVESDAPAPRGIYAEAKLATEAIAAGDPRCTIVRLANVYGSGMSPANVLSDILAQLGTPGPLRMRDLAPVRDYVHVSDIAAAFVALAGTTVSGTFNLGSGRGLSVEELARIVCRVAGEGDRALEATQPADRASTLVLDATRARTLLAWHPMISIEDGLANLVRERMQ